MDKYWILQVRYVECEVDNVVMIETLSNLVIENNKVKGIGRYSHYR